MMQAWEPTAGPSRLPRMNLLFFVALFCALVGLALPKLFAMMGRRR